MDSKKILIAGAGSLGTYLALRLNTEKNKVYVLRSSKLKGIKTGEMININEEQYKMPNIIEEIPHNSKYDYVFLTSKLYDLRNLIKELSKKEVKLNLLISIQNTLFDDLWYFGYIKDKPFVIASVYEGYYLEGKKIYKSESKGKGWFVEDDILGKDVSNLLNKAGITTGLVSDLRKLRSEKTVFNCSLNAMSALEDKTFKEIYSVPKLRKKIKLIFDESYDVLSELVKMKAKRLLWQELVDRIKQMSHYSSTWQDVRSGRKTEVAFLNGYIVNLGKTLGKSTPANLNLVEDFRKKYPNQYFVQI